MLISGREGGGILLRSLFLASTSEYIFIVMNLNDLLRRAEDKTLEFKRDLDSP